MQLTMFNKWMQRLIAGMENPVVPLHLYFVSFLSVLVLRYLGEGYSQPYNYLNVPSSSAYFWSFIHTAIGYIALGLGFIAIIRLAASVPFNRAARFVMTGYIIIFMTPLLDLMLGPITEWPTANMYIHPNMNVNIPYAFLTLYGGFAGMSLGLRIEIIALVIGLFVYFSTKGYRIVSSAALTAVSYTWLFFMSCSPYVVSMLLHGLGKSYQYSNTTMIRYYVLVSVLIGGLLRFVDSKPHSLIAGRR